MRARTHAHTQPHTHTQTETSAGHHHHSGNNTRDGYHKGKLWAPRPSWEDDLASPEQWTVGIRLSCIDLPPMASPARLSERRTDKKTHNIFLSLSLAPSRCLSFLSVRRAPTDQRGWAESWTTCWQDLLNSPQWHIVQGKEGEAEVPVHSYFSLNYWVRALIKPSLHYCYFSLC